jgi:hypothetical protein
MIKIVPAWAVVFLALGTCVSETPKIISPDVVRVAEVPPFPFYLEQTRCDRGGNLYFHVETSNSLETFIMRLSPDGRDGTAFRPSGDFADKFLFADYSVTPSGSVYVFAPASNNDQTPFLFGFDNDGAVKTNPTRLDLPKDVVSDNIAVFDSGTILFSGHYIESAQPALRGKSYAALFDVSGTLLKHIQLPLPDFKEGAAPSIGGAVAEDGNIYFLAGDKITAISQAGEVVRRFTIKKPQSASSLTGIRVSGGYALVTVTLSAPEIARGAFSFGYLTVDLSSGKPLGFYQLPTKLNFADAACYTRNEGLTFIGVDSKEGKTKIFTVALQ